MVAERIKLTMTAASARRKREGKPQAAQQEDPELRVGGCEVSKVRLRGARIAGAGSKALPALERPRITGGFSDAMGRGRGSSAGAYGCPVRSVTAESAQMRLRKDGGCGRGEGAVAAEGTKQPVRRSWGTGMDDGQGVAPRGPMRGKALGGQDPRTAARAGQCGGCDPAGGRLRAQGVWPGSGRRLHRVLLHKWR